MLNIVINITLKQLSKTLSQSLTSPSQKGRVSRRDREPGLWWQLPSRRLCPELGLEFDEFRVTFRHDILIIILRQTISYKDLDIIHDIRVVRIIIIYDVVIMWQVKSTDAQVFIRVLQRWWWLGLFQLCRTTVRRLWTISKASFPLVLRSTGNTSTIRTTTRGPSSNFR